MSRRILPGLAALLLLVLLVAGYSTSRHGDFQFDDTPSITDNRAIKDLRGFLGALSSRAGALGRPLAELTFAIDYWRAGLDPVAFHTTSLAVHLVVVLLVFLFVRETLRRAGRDSPEGLALAVAGLWGLHPLQSQAVSYIVQRAEALASAFYLFSLLLLLGAYRRGRTAGGAALYLSGALAFVLGLQAKLIVLTLPAALLLHLALFPVEAPGTSPRRRWLGRAAAAVPLLAVTALVATGALSGLRGHTDAGFDVQVMTPESYALSQLRVVWRYLSLLAWPAGQSVDHDFAPSRTLLDPPATLLAGLALAALVTGGAWLGVRSLRSDRPPEIVRAERVTAFGVFWFLLLLSPTSSVVPVVDVIFEHRTYLASLGIALALAAWGDAALQQLVPAPRRLATGAGLVLVLWAGLAAVLHERNRAWASPVTLWTDARDKAPGKWRPHFNLGDALATAGDEEGAVREYLVASRLQSDDPLDRYRLLRNLGASLGDLGRTDEALGYLSEALRIQPASPEIHNNLALAWLRKGVLDRAEDHAMLAIRAHPMYGESYNTLGEIRAARGDLPGALQALSAAARLLPDTPAVLENVAQVQAEMGLLREACDTLLRSGQIRGGAGRARAEERRALLGCSGRPGP